MPRERFYYSDSNRDIELKAKILFQLLIMHHMLLMQMYYCIISCVLMLCTSNDKRIF